MKLNELLKIKYPIIQGGMANIATGEFAASVSNAGGLGLIGAGGMNAKMLKEEIQKCKKLTDHPFGVNIMLLNPEAKEMAQIVIDEQVPIVTTGAGNPGIYMKMWKEAGIKVFPVVPSVALAKRLERAGADAGKGICHRRRAVGAHHFLRAHDDRRRAAGGAAVSLHSRRKRQDGKRACRADHALPTDSAKREGRLQ